MTTTALQLVIKRLAKASGVNRLYPHLLRHTCATLFLINGGDVFLLQQNLEHTSLEMVRRYVHLGQPDGGRPEPELFAAGSAGG